jgi:MFS family permease
LLTKGSAGSANARDGSGVMGGLSFALLLNSQLLATTAFMFVVPFMPLYVQQLGVEDAGHAAAWAGFINGASGATMALIAPLWGTLSDRLGRKIMLLRATLAAAVVVGSMGFVSARSSVYPPPLASVLPCNDSPNPLGATHAKSSDARC